LRGRALGAGTGGDRDRRRGRPAPGSGPAGPWPAPPRRRPGRGRPGRGTAVPGGAGDAGVCRVRRGVLVLDRLDPGTGEVRRRRAAVGAGAGLAGAGRARRRSVAGPGARAPAWRSARAAACRRTRPGMGLDAARVELRPRSPWEAMELGVALVRRHARAVWRPWALVTLPVFALLNAAAWAMDAMWLAALAMWWLLPLFDRIVLVVLSRAVFGPAPGVREVLVAQRRLGTGGTPARLAWARLSPWRCIVMPVELLEGGDSVAGWWPTASRATPSCCRW